MAGPHNSIFKDFLEIGRNHMQFVHNTCKQSKELILMSYTSSRWTKAELEGFMKFIELFCAFGPSFEGLKHWRPLFCIVGRTCMEYGGVLLDATRPMQMVVYILNLLQLY